MAKPRALPLSEEEEMTSSSTIRPTGRELSPASLAIAFAAGFVAVLTFYEAVFLLLYVGGVIPVPPFSMKPMPPFGVPEVLSQSFWGGVWGIVFLLIVPRLVGLRLGANIGYLKFTPEPTWNPF